MVELNDVILEQGQEPLSAMAWEGRLTCISGSTEECRRRLLMALMGFEPIAGGCISYDGEPLSERNVQAFRLLTAFVPKELETIGVVTPYPPPSVQQVFALKANRQQPISNGILAEEMKRTGVEGPQAQWLAVAALLNKPVLLADHPAATAVGYLHSVAEKGRVVIVATNEQAIISQADTVIHVGV